MTRKIFPLNYCSIIEPASVGLFRPNMISTWGSRFFQKLVNILCMILNWDYFLEPHAGKQFVFLFFFMIKKYQHQIHQSDVCLFFTVFDSFGKPTSGLMQVDLSFLGSYSECLDILPEGVEPQFTGQYCLATFNLPDSAISTLQRISGLAASSLSNANTKLGLCVPSTCRMDEIKLITDKGRYQSIFK